MNYYSGWPYSDDTAWAFLVGFLRHGLDIPLGHPAVSTGDEPVGAGDLYDAGELGAEAGAGLIALADQAQVAVLAVGIVEHADLAGAPPL